MLIRKNNPTFYFYNPTTAADFARLFDPYITQCDVKAKTRQAYNKALQRFAEFHAMNESTKGRQLILNYKEFLKNHYKPSTANLYLSGIRGFFRWLAFKDICTDWTAGIKTIRDTKEYKRDELRISEIQRVMKAIDRSTIKGKRDYAILCLALATGIRTISISLANVSDYEAERDVLMYQGKGHEAKDTAADIPHFAAAALSDYHTAAGITEGALFQSLGRVKQGDKRIPPETISNIIKAMFRAAGINSQRITAHSLRHTYATTLYRAGVKLDDIAAKLGHSGTETTKKYVHMASRNDLRAGDIIEQQIFAFA